MTHQEKALEFNRATRAALETVLGELNQGQRKKLRENEKVRPILVRYGLEEKP